MFCSNCGKQLEDNVAFCPECGTKVAAAEAPATPVVEKTAESPIVAAPVASTTQETKKQSKAPIIVIIILLLLVIALGIAIWYLYNNKKQDRDDDWESTEAFADEDEDDEEDKEKPTPEPTEAPTPEPTDEPSPEPAEEPEAEPTDDTIVWDDQIFDVDTSAYEKCTVYETEMDVSGMVIKDKQTILADGDMVAILLESTTIDLSDISQDEINYYVEAYAESYEPIRENAPDCVEVIYGLDGNTYRFDMMIDLVNADLKELADAGYISITSGSVDTATFISYEQTCAGLEAGGYTLVE